MNAVWTYMHQGGIMMWPLVLCSVLAVDHVGARVCFSKGRQGGSGRADR